MQKLNLEDVQNVVQVFSPSQCDFISENCIVAFENSNHTTGCILSVTGDKQKSFSLEWSKKINRAGYKEPKKIIEHAAEGIAFLLVPEFTEYSVIEESVIGTGFDYWLGYNENHEKYDPLNFLNARLEISGIQTESQSNTIDRRVKEKKIQTSASDSLKLPAYVSVTEFGQPKSYFGIK